MKTSLVKDNSRIPLKESMNQHVKKSYSSKHTGGSASLIK